MKTTLTVLLATWFACAPARAADPMYLRGGFNGWGLDHPLVERGGGVFEATVTLSPGNHPFKVGSKDWSAEWVANPERSISVAPGSAYPLDKHAGPEDYLFVKQSADYRFRLDLSKGDAPVLSVTRIETTQQAQPDPHLGHKDRAALHFSTFDGKRETVRFSSPDAGAPLRSYVQSTSMQLRDPGPQSAAYSETAQLPVVRSGSLAFDALFALATAEMRQDAVSQIRDGNYNGGAPVACDCFETGEKWHYVWTRDLSYAADLGLALLDPQRVRNSLEFKLSPWRAGVARPANAAGSDDGLQIIQDTGSGGSWPVSTDRITWAFGAERVLATLPAAERDAFARRALAALSNTIANDRLATFDARSGLYTGEQSFLDWRDQSYAAWIVNDIASLASSKSLSTNVGHYKALTLAASLAREQGQAERAATYTDWARALKSAINTRLWLDDAGMYSSLTAPHFDGAPMHKFDWLGQSLAIITGVADAERTRQILARYPHGPLGAPVIYPQQQDLPVYHNRAMWPFVTAYGLRAAVIGRNVSVADAAYASLMRGAALNLSNMENLEWLSGQPLLLDEQHPDLIGPVINSKRQLWSVGAYLGMVVENVFGVSASDEGIAVKPFITARLRREAFGASRVIALDGLRLHGKRLTVRVHLPKAVPTDGYYTVAGLVLDGTKTGQNIAWDRLRADSVIEVTLGQLERGRHEIQRVGADPYSESPAVFGPREPAIASLARAGDGVTLAITPSRGPHKTVYNIYRDGQLAAAGITSAAWTDRHASAASCYAVEAQFAASGNRSHHSPAVCSGAALEIAVPGAPLKGWGELNDALVIGDVTVHTGGQYQVQLRYFNGANQINLGISGGVKWLAVQDAAGATVAQGVVQMPHARREQSATPPVYSTPLAVTLAPGKYRLVLSDFYNMSYLQANSTFSAAGGADGPANRVDLYGARLLPTAPKP